VPPLPPRSWPTNKQTLAALGVMLVQDFCGTNEVKLPMIRDVAKADWFVGSCAYYRPDTPEVRAYMESLERKGQGPGINVCVDHCGRPCTEGQARAWSWPGSDTDRTPYGVLAHELGHHVDWLTGGTKGKYWSNYCVEVMEGSGEKSLTNYAAANPAEWFAEAFRLFVTNPDLLRLLRPKTYAILVSRWRPVKTQRWDVELGANVPPKVLRTLRNKGAR
jgi:hypothetical protein